VGGGVTVGVVTKWVNFGKGWRPRLFVLRGNVLRYYKLGGGRQDLLVSRMLADLARGGAKSVGDDVRELIAKGRQERGSGDGEAERGAQQQPQGEIHLAVATVRQSGSEPRKFYVYSGTRQLEMLAVSARDCKAWVSALSEAKAAGRLDGSLAALTLSPPAKEVASMGEELLEGLRQAGCPEELVKRAGELHKDLMAEREWRERLQRAVLALEEDKSQLEGASLVTHTAGGLAAMTPAPLAYHEDPEDEDGVDGGDGLGRGAAKTLFAHDPPPASALSYGSDDDDDDVYYDCWNGRGSNGESGLGGGFPAAASPELPAQGGGRVRATSVTMVKPRPEQTEDGKTLWPMPPGLEKEAVPTRRRELGVMEGKEKKVSLWNIIKDMIGKDLTRISLPVFLNEPLSGLQKACEDLEYVQLVNEAAKCPKGSKERMMFMTAFVVSSYSSVAYRTKKPFNPLLGETYEYACPEEGWRYFSEKVWHHPTIAAGYAEGRGWTYKAAGELKAKFWGRSLELQPVGWIHVEFADGEKMKWNKVVSSVNNIIVGKLKIEHHGVARLESSEGLLAKVRFKDNGILERKSRQVMGHIEDPGGEHLADLWGKWDDRLMGSFASDGEEHLLWEMKPIKRDPENRYLLNDFGLSMNELCPSIKDKLPSTDSRFRPDQLLVERGLYDDALKEKNRLEEKQRKVRKEDAKNGVKYKPRWFRINQGSNPKNWKMEDGAEYLGGYWETRETGDWGPLRDIYT
tara:strand:- start:231 stop:2456 length:2226 start_codon:yes stop_codon:yes gene_type:complete